MYTSTERLYPSLLKKDNTRLRFGRKNDTLTISNNKPMTETFSFEIIDSMQVKSILAFSTTKCDLFLLFIIIYIILKLIKQHTTVFNKITVSKERTIKIFKGETR